MVIREKPRVAGESECLLVGVGGWTISVGRAARQDDRQTAHSVSENSHTFFNPIPVHPTEYNYGHVMGLSLLFLEAQRSGKMPKGNRIAWRGDSALKDGSDVGLDLTGGWYDAGDHVKFNFPMAFTCTSIAWGGDEYWDAWKQAGEEKNLLASLKWVTDYLIKCHPDKDTYYVQIGNG